MARKHLSVSIIEDKPAAEGISLSTNLSVSFVKKLMNAGAVWQVTNSKQTRLRKHKKNLNKGTALEIFIDDDVLNYKPENHPILIGDSLTYSVWFKPPGWVSQGTKFGDKYSILRHAEVKFNKAFLIHRLDREVFGLMVVAKSAKTASFISRNWKSSETKKIYQAILLGQLELEENQIIDINFDLDGKKSLSRVKLLKKQNGLSHVEVEILTGRKHQIRRHLAEFGHPVIGDPKYGKSNKNKEGILLAAVKLSFPDPDTPGNEIKSFELPADLMLRKNLNEYLLNES